MAQDIVSGVFGLSPWQVRQQQQQQMNQQAQQFAQMPAVQRGVMGVYQGGSGIADIGAGMMGMVDPAVQEAQQRQAALQGLDISSPEAILQRAQQIQDPQLRMRLMLMAQQMKAQQQEAAYKQAQTKRAEAQAERDYAMANKALMGEPEMKYAPEIQKLIALRDSLPDGDPRKAMVEAAIRKATYISEPKSLEDVEASKIRVMEEKERIKAQSLKDKQQADDAKSFKWMDKKFSEIENTMADSLGIPVEKLGAALTTEKGASEKSLDRAVGWIDAMVMPLSQVKTNILSHINRLKSLAQTGGIAELRAAGVAPGSITEREWPKFQADLGNIDEKLDAPELVKQYIRIFQRIQDTRTLGKEAIGAETSSAGKWEASTPDEVRALFKAGKITRETAKAILKDMGL